jgi:HEAT repeat protein
MTSVDEWRTFLQHWSDDWLAIGESFSPAVRRARWLGFKPATEAQIAKLEVRIGYRLPPSYRAFLLTTNGWRTISRMIGGIRPAAKVEWLDVVDPQRLDAYDVRQTSEPYDGVSREEYFSYDGRPTFDVAHLKRSLKIADSGDGDTAIYLLNPLVVTEDGEWEAWIDAHWIPGAERYPSFAHLMRAEYASFRIAELGKSEEPQIVGPYDGVYAPDRPRHEAPRIGPGQRKPRRLTVGELIARLEDPSPKLRCDAARQLFREYRPHDRANERPGWVAPLTRIMRSSSLEPEVRQAATLMLGTFGTPDAIEPLVSALHDDVVAGSAVSALFYLHVELKDPRMADGLIEYLARPREYMTTSTAMNILTALADERLVAIAWRLLDDPTTFWQLRSQAAFTVAKLDPSAADGLIARLAHENAQVREVAAAALRETKDRRAIAPLRALLDDASDGVRMQASMSLRFLGEDV